MEPVLRLALRTRRLPLAGRYAISTALVLAAAGARWGLLGPEPGWVFVAFYPAVAIAGLMFNGGSGILATALSAILGVYLFIAPVGQLALTTDRDLIGLLIFIGTAAFLAVLTEGMHTAFARMVEAQGNLEAANSQLQTANAQLQTANGRLAQAESQTAILLHETIHRFRNDLQRLSSTVALQMSACSDPAVKAALIEVEGRIAALAAIKARLDVALISEGEATFVESRAFFSGLVEDWVAATGIRPVSCRVDAESHSVPASRAVLFGLILNELMTNAIKYAFPADRPGTIYVAFRREGDEYHLTVEDNGIGHDPGAPPRGTGLGGRITRGLARQMGGAIDIGLRPGCGTICHLHVPAGVALA